MNEPHARTRSENRWPAPLRGRVIGGVPDTRLLIAAWALAACACEFSVDGFEDLVDPSATFVAFPGDQIVSERVSDLAIDGTEQQGGHLLARNAAGELLIAKMDGSGSCNAGPAVLYRPFSRLFGRDRSFDGVLPFLSERDETGRGKLHFVDFDCQSLLPVVEDAALPSNGLFTSGQPSLLGRVGASAVWVFDPWNGASRALTTEAGVVQTSNRHLWIAEGTQVVLYDDALEKVGQLGTDVREHVVVQPFDEFALAFVDASGLHLASPELETRTITTDSSCALLPAVEGFPNAFGYFSPCEERRLVLYEIAAQKEHVFGAGVGGSPIVRRDLEATYVFYLTDVGSDRWVGTLWGAVTASARQPAQERAPEVIGASGHLRKLGAVNGGMIRAIVDFDGQKGRLVEWRPGAGTREVAENVADLREPYALVNYTGATGELVRLLPDGGLQTIAGGVPEISLGGRENGETAFLTDFDGATGTLMWVENWQAAPKTIAMGVSLRSFEFLIQAEALAYLTNYSVERGGGTLAVHFTKTGNTFQVDQPINQWGEIGWPRPGLLYNVTSGSAAGVWIAKLP